VRLRRTLLFVPGVTPERIAKAAASRADKSSDSGRIGRLRGILIQRTTHVCQRLRNMFLHRTHGDPLKPGNLCLDGPDVPDEAQILRLSFAHHGAKDSMGAESAKEKVRPAATLEGGAQRIRESLVMACASAIACTTVVACTSVRTLSIRPGVDKCQ